MPLNKATKYKRFDVNKYMKEQRLVSEFAVKRKIELSNKQRKLRRLDEKVRLVEISRIMLLKAWELNILHIEFEGAREA